MAYTYTHTPVLSKVKIGENTYYLKDADVRNILDTFNNAVVTNEIGTVEGNDGKFVTAANIKAYVDSAVSVGIELIVVETLPTASANTKGKIYLLAHQHGTQDIYDEFITVENPTGTFKWEKIGNTDIDLSGYVTDVIYENKTLKQQKGNGAYANVHEFGNLADANTASGTVTTVDSATFSEGAVSASGSYTPAGIITVNNLTQTATSATLTRANYTPEGTVTIDGDNNTVKSMETAGSVTAGTAPTFTEGTFTPNVPTAIDTSKFNGGSLAAPTKSSFATAGITASVGTDDDAETLIFGNASTAQAVTEQGAYTAASLAPGFYTAGSAASKAADTFNAGTPTAVTLPTFEDVTVLTGATATFTGTEVENFQVTDVSYDRATANGGTFTGTAATVSVTGTATGDVELTKTAKTVTVTPDPKNQIS